MVKGSSQREIIRMNSPSPVDKTDVEYVLAGTVLFLATVFFLAFTGKKEPWKNRTAIIFSYVVIALFLAVPLLAPVLLIHTFPTAMNAMIGAPAGLINTHTANQEKCETQWALNIGGYSYVPATSCIDKNKKEEGPSDAKNPAVTEATAPNASSGNNPQNSGSKQGQQPVLTGSQAPSENGPAGKTTTTPSSGTQTTRAPSAGTRYAGPNPVVKPPIVEVQGGLVIPLYVIILSVIGGAINMTRKVPGFQKEGEESDFSIARPISSLGLRVMKLVRRDPSQTEDAKSAMVGEGEASKAAVGTVAPLVQPAEQAAKQQQSLQEQAEKVEKDLEPLVVNQIVRNCDSDRILRDIRLLVGKMQELYRIRTTDEPLLKFDSFEDWAASHPRLSELLRGTWRVELLNQYMYLISAPFLAVVTYYILDLLGLSKQGVIVVLSFSVGLISEKIVSWILGIATGYMRADTKKATP